MRQCLLCECFWLDSHLDTFHFGSSLVVALVKGHFLLSSNISKLFIQIYSFTLSLGVRFRV